MGCAKAFIAGFSEGLDGDRCYRSGHGCEVVCMIEMVKKEKEEIWNQPCFL